MAPVVFDGCFGWLHPAAGAGTSDTAVLLCAGLARDGSTGHRSLRVLGNRLATAGYPVLRFDYPGTGDSCDLETSEHWAALRDSVHAAADWLLARTKARRIVLCGLRIGATLAALVASERSDAVGLILLQPVLRGKSYVGQLLVEARVRGHGDIAPDGGVTVDELRLTAETLRLISQVDLRQVQLRPWCPVSVFNQHPSPILTACKEAWQGQGVRVASADFAGLEDFLRPSHLADEPLADVTPILSWIQAAVPVRTISPAPTEAVREAALLRPAGCIETPLRFGRHGHLFGMLSHPDGNVPCDRVVVIGNAGGDPHHGFARFSVEFARHLATQGIASLRMDFAGLGDSLSPSGDAESPTHVFTVDRSPDFSAAIDMLEAMGYRHFVANGLCSGAFHALQAGLEDKRIGTLLLVNLPWFTLRYDKVGTASFSRRIMVTLSERKVSTLLLFGEGDPGVKMLEKHFGPGGLGLAELPATVVEVVEGLDHDLTASAMRRLAAEHMIDFLRHHPSGHDRQSAVEAVRTDAAQQHSKLPALTPPRAHNVFADLTQSLAS